MKSSIFKEAVKLLKYGLVNFATPVIFYLAFKGWGTKPAISFAVGTALLQIAFHLFYRLKFTPFFFLATFFTLAFGGLDLFITNPHFFRLEPAIHNLVLATILLGMVLARVSVVSYFAEALPEKMRPDFSQVSPRYIKNLTWIWIAYLYLKGLIYLDLAFRVNLGDLIALKAIVGGGSLLLLFIGEVFFRRFWKKV